MGSDSRGYGRSLVAVAGVWAAVSASGVALDAQLDTTHAAPGQLTYLEILVVPQPDDPGDTLLLSVEIPTGIEPIPLEVLMSPVDSDGLISDCSSTGLPGVCEPGDRLEWLFAPGSLRRYVVPLSVAPGTAAGTTIDWTVVAQRDGEVVAQVAATLVALDAPLASVSLDVRQGTPALLGGTLNYVLHYANPGDAPLTSVSLTAALPPDLEFIEATAEPTTTPGQIVWSLGTLAPGAGGWVSFTLARTNLDPGQLTTIAATLNAQAGGQPVAVGTAESSVVLADLDTNLALTLNAASATPGESMDVVLHVSRPQNAPFSPVSAWLRFPDGLAPVGLFSITGIDTEVSCNQVGAPGICEAGDILELLPFVDNPFRYGVVSIPARVGENATPGTLVQWRAAAASTFGPVVWRETAGAVAAASLPFSVDGTEAEVIGGLGMDYVLHIGNPTDEALDLAVVTARLADQAQLISASDVAVVDGQHVTWPGAFVPPGGTREYRLSVVTHPNGAQDDLVATTFELVAHANGVPVRQTLREVAPRQSVNVFESVLFVDQQVIPPSQGTEVRMANSLFGSGPENSEFLLRLPDIAAPFSVDELAGPWDEFRSCGAIGLSEACEPNDVLVFEPAPTGFASEVDVVSFPLRADPARRSGELLRLERLVRTGFFHAPYLREQRTVRLDSAAQLEVLIEPSDTIVPQTDVGPVYSVLYANRGQQSIATTLTVEVPPFVPIASVSGNGILDLINNTVSWDLPLLAPGQIGRQRIATSAFEDDLAVPLGVSARLSSDAGAFGPVSLAAQDVGSTSFDSPFSLALHVRKNRSTDEDAFVVTVDLANLSDQSLDAGTLAVRVPEGFALVLEELILGRGFSADLSCQPSADSLCEANERIVWEPGVVAPGEVLSFSFPAIIDAPQSLAPDLLPLEAIATGFADRARRAEGTALVDNGGWSLSVDVDNTPVLPGDLIRAVIHYARDDSAVEAADELAVAVPPGTEFVSASSLGTLNPVTGLVSWVPAGLDSGGAVRRDLVLRALPQAPAGTLVNVRADLVGFSGTVAQGASHAAQVGAPRPLSADVTLDPPLAAPGSPVRVEIVLTNTSDSPVSSAEVRLRYPYGFDFLDVADITGPLSASACDDFGDDGICQSGEFVVFDIGPLDADEAVTLELETAVLPFALNGTLVPLAVRVVDDTGGEAWFRRTLAISALGDSDNDGILDVYDNCVDTPNTAQRDSNGDSFGNACDADLNDDCIVNIVDLGLLRTVFFTDDADADFNGDGVVNVVDLGVMRNAFFGPPGPSALAEGCTAAP